MATVQSPVSDMIVTVKTREVQRGMLAEMRGDKTGTARHLLAAAHLELVLADDYAHAGQKELAMRSRLSAASCLWRAGEMEQARAMFNTLQQEDPVQSSAVRQLIAELEHNHPKRA